MELAQLTCECRAVIDAIVEGDDPWKLHVDLMTSGHHPDDLAELELDGWLALWELPGSPAWTLSPLGAMRAKVKLTESGWEEEPRWIDEGQEHGPIVERRPAWIYTLDHPSWLVDETPGVAELLTADEEWARRPAGEDGQPGDPYLVGGRRVRLSEVVVDQWTGIPVEIAGACVLRVESKKKGKAS